MVKGHNQQDQKKPNVAQKSAQTVSKKDQNRNVNAGRKSVDPATGKGKNSIK